MSPLVLVGENPLCNHCNPQYLLKYFFWALVRVYVCTEKVKISWLKRSILLKTIVLQKKQQHLSKQYKTHMHTHTHTLQSQGEKAQRQTIRENMKTSTFQTLETVGLKLNWCDENLIFTGIVISISNFIC